MSATVDPGARRASDLALGVYLQPLIEDRRVLWLGDAQQGAPEFLAASARTVHVVDPSGAGRSDSAGRGDNPGSEDGAARGTGGRAGRSRIRTSPYRGGNLAFRDRSFDVVVVPEAQTVGLDGPARLADLARLLDGGVLIVGTDAGPSGLGYDALFELLSDRFDAVRMLGQAPFGGVSVVVFGSDPNATEVVLDASLLEDGNESPTRYLAIAAPTETVLDDYAVVQVPLRDMRSGDDLRAEAKAPPLRRRREPDLREKLDLAEAARVAAEKDVQASAARIQSLEGDIARNRADSEELGRRLAAATTAESEASSKLAALESEITAERPPEDLEQDYSHLEQVLRERAEAVSELRAEVDRRGLLVRDLIEELRAARETAGTAAGGGLGGGDPAGQAPLAPGDPSDDRTASAAQQRVLAAESARVAAQFENDELRGRLLRCRAQAELVAGQEARLMGTARGLQSRLLETEEMRELAQGELSLTRHELALAQEQQRGLERQLGESREALELALIRARTGEQVSSSGHGIGAEDAAPHGAVDAAVGGADSDEVELALAERDRARADNLRLTALISGLEHRRDGAERGYRLRVLELEADLLEAVTEARARDDQSAALSLLATGLRGEREGLAYRLRDRELALHALGKRAANATDLGGSLVAARDEMDRLRERVALLGEQETVLTLRMAEAEERAEAATHRAGELSSSMAARDALVARLQMDLAEEEQRARVAEQQADRAIQETGRLREAVVAASERVGEVETLIRRVSELELVVAERDEREQALRELVSAQQTAIDEVDSLQAERERLLDEYAALQETLSAVNHQLAADHAAAAAAAADLEAEREKAARLQADAESAAAAAAKSEAERAELAAALREARELLAGLAATAGDGQPHRSATGDLVAERIDASSDGNDALRAELDALTRENRDQETLLRSLTAQLEDRNERIRRFELGEVGGSGPSDAAAVAEAEVLKRELMELEQRVSRLSDELSHEREARHAAESGAADRISRGDHEREVRRLHHLLGDRDAEVLLMKGRVASGDRDMRGLREACAEARSGLEGLLGDATAHGDPATAERIGYLLRVLAKF